MLTLYVGGGHPRYPGPPPGGEEHHRDAGHHGSGSPASGDSLRHGRVRAVRPHPAAAAGALQRHPTPVRQQGKVTAVLPWQPDTTVLKVLETTLLMM